MLDLHKANEDNVKIGSNDPELQMSMHSQSSLSFVDRAIGSLGSIIVPGTAVGDDEYGYDTADASEDLQPSDLAGEGDRSIASGDHGSVAPDGMASQSESEVQEEVRRVEQVTDTLRPV